jgi:hypothetical protein
MTSQTTRNTPFYYMQAGGKYLSDSRIQFLKIYDIICADLSQTFIHCHFTDDAAYKFFR